MKSWIEGWRRLTRIWRPSHESDIESELQFHFEQKIAEFRASGSSEIEAMKRAQEEFGDVVQVRASLREIDERLLKKRKRADWWETAAQDLRYVFRSLRRSPIFTFTVVITLTLGFGANAALFSILDEIFLRAPSGVADAGSLRRLNKAETIRGQPYTTEGFTYPELKNIRESAPPSVQIANFISFTRHAGRKYDSPNVEVAFVEGDYFKVLGVRAEIGRPFTPDEFRIQGLSMVAVISHDLWKRQFDGDPNILGKTIDLESHRHVIVGVAPPNFHGTELSATDLWVPMNTQGKLSGRNATWYDDANYGSIQGIVRYGAGANDVSMNALATRGLHATKYNPQLWHDSLATVKVGSIIAARNGSDTEYDLSLPTRLAGVAAVILIIACANVVNLLLARITSRQREVAVRLALGVSRSRLVLHLVSESVVLALMSALASLVVANSIIQVLRKLLFHGVNWGASPISPRVVAFTLTVAVLVGMIVGILPALLASRGDLTLVLKSGTRSTVDRRRKLRTTFIVAQTALSVVLLAGAGVFVRSLHNVKSIPIGFDSNQLLFARVNYDEELENRGEEISRHMIDAAERVRRIPGVQSVAVTATTPMENWMGIGLTLPGRDSLPPRGDMGLVFSPVSPEYFETVGIKLLRGRLFTNADLGKRPVVIVNETMAGNFWPGENPIGKCVIVGPFCDEVVGVVSSTHYGRVVEEKSLQWYMPIALSSAVSSNARVLVIRTNTEHLEAVRDRTQRVLAETYGSWARPSVRSIDDLTEREMRSWRVGAELFSAAGILALIVAAVGVYSSIAYSITQRTHEMGVRIALGARVADILQLIVGEGVGVVAFGIALGVIAALGLGAFVASMLYETSPRDPIVLGTSAIVLLLVAATASAIPAVRASRVDPLAALRAE